MTINAEFKLFWNVKPHEINASFAGKQSYIIPFGSMIPNFGGSGGGAVDSVNGKTGHVTLDANDVDAYSKQESDALLDAKQDALPTNGDGTKYLSDDGTYKEIQPRGDAYTKTETDTLLDDKADKNSISVVGYSNDYNDLDNLPTNISAFNNDAGYLTQHQDISGKVDKEVGKGLSTNDYTNIDKSKVDKIVTDGVGDKYLSDDGIYKTVSGGGGGGVTSVNAKTGVVVLNATDVGAVDAAGVVTEVNKFLKVLGIGIAPNVSFNQSIGIGFGSVALNTDSVAIGNKAKALLTHSVAIGSEAQVTGNYSAGVAIGRSSNAYENGVAIGSGTKSRPTGVAIGVNAKADGTTSTVIGATATTLTYTNSTALGYQATVTANNQVQLGDSQTTTYAYGAVQDRSDIRDKTDIRDIALGLDFINKLRPVEYKWDYREDYFADVAPKRDDFDSDEEYSTAYEQARIAFFENPVKDGSKTRTRHHTGLIAQEVKQAMDDLGVDFGGLQHHQEKGGLDVMSLGYNELIAVLIKAIQELDAKLKALT